MSKIAAIFFDLGDTLGTAIVGGTPPRLVEFDVFPFVSSLLADLRDRGLRLGVISNTGDEKKAAVEAVLRQTAGFLDQFDPALFVYSGDEGVTKASAEIFDRAASRAGKPSAECLFVGESAAERVVAKGAGWVVCPHPNLVDEVLTGMQLQYVRLTNPPPATAWRAAVAQRRAFVPMHFAGQRGTTVYGLTSRRVALELANMRFEVGMLGEPDLPQTTDLYLLRDDLARTTGLTDDGDTTRAFAGPDAAGMVVSVNQDGVIAAVPPGVPEGIDAFHFDNARHGHTLKLIPDPLLWDAATSPSTGFVVGFADAAWQVPAEVMTELGSVDPASIGHTVRRYSGLEPLDGPGGTPVKSRHILEAGNARAVAQLAADLEAIGGLRVRLHQFTHAGRTLHNVEAELTGESPELVLVTAHLDSTAASDDDFDPAASSAPGADDDASGVAAVLAAAERFVAMSASLPLGRTVRFVLFNAEEQGLVGSRAYARRSKARGEAIAAVWQMDMVGFNAVPPLSWEVHAGFQPSPAVEARSRVLGHLLAEVASQVSPELEPVQVLHSAVPGGDPADGRSDHSSFQAYGYAACVVSEDFFVDGPGGAEPDANPNYHRQGDTVIDEAYTTAITRAVSAAAWLTANPTSQLAAVAAVAAGATFFGEEPAMPLTRELDTRTRTAPRSAAMSAADALVRPRTVTNALTGSLSVVPATAPTLIEGSLVERALMFAQRNAVTLGFEAGQTPEFAPDPAIQRTTSGSAAVNLKQMHYGLPVFQMSRTVRFDPNGQTVDAVGDSAPISGSLSIEPRLTPEAAVLKAAEHLASSGVGERVRDQFGQEAPVPTVDITGFQPEVLSGFPLPSRPTVLDRGPFENFIPAYLLVFHQPGRPRLGWHIVLTFEGYADQYTVIVAADDPKGEILYSKSTMRRAAARGRVFEFSPALASRRMIEFPRPLSDYPAMPTSPLSGFPADWVDADKTFGNSTRATLNFTGNSLKGSLNGSVLEFDPADETGDEQKLLNIFYFCNYMHDFLYILGFDEASGNFQQVNFTSTGAGGDAVRARAHSGAVNGTANMTTGPDGLPPLMNMGLVLGSNRHTAFDADVVFHEYVHGLTNRLVGGRLNAHALDKLQSGGMGEGWSDYFALTVQNFFLQNERLATGDWVVNNSDGIRRELYDDNYPFKYGSLSQSPEVHDIGEVWCTALMMMTRKLVTVLGNKQQGYRLAWAMVCDGLKITPANPTFLDARDAILRALEDLSTVRKIPPAVFTQARKAAWESFAHFEMGANAFSDDADDLDGIVPDSSVPAGV